MGIFILSLVVWTLSLLAGVALSTRRWVITLICFVTFSQLLMEIEQMAGSFWISLFIGIAGVLLFFAALCGCENSACECDHIE